MLNPDNHIRHVVLQSEDSQSLDDVVVTHENGVKEFIQVKHTRDKDKLSYSDMVEGGKKGSNLYKYSSEWKSMYKCQDKIPHFFHFKYPHFYHLYHFE